MKKGLKLFRIFGIDINLHFSWWFIFILIAWSLSTAYFPLYAEGYTTSTYWGMGIAASILLFISVLLHELSHSLVARIKNIKVESITLFFFGGVAGIEDEEMSPAAEFQMAIAGPLFSLLLAGIFYVVTIFNGNGIVTAISSYLWQLNLILAIFNLVPGYPLDGGRAFRAILHSYYKDIVKATRIAVSGGRIVAFVLVGLGIWGMLTGTGGGLWFILIGGFLYFISGASYEQVLIKQVLDKIPVKELMKKASSVSPELKFSEFLKKYSKSEAEAFLVKGKSFSGVLDLKRVRRLGPGQESLKLKNLAIPMKEIKKVSIKDSAYVAFTNFLKQNLDLLPVMSGGRISGVITKTTVMHRLMWNLNYESGNSRTLRRLSRRVRR